MTVELREGWFGVNTEREVVGPFRFERFFIGTWDYVGSRSLFGGDGKSVDACDRNIIAVFPDRASAEAYLRGDKTLGDAIEDTKREMAGSHIDWEKRRWDAAMEAPEPPDWWDGSGLSGNARRAEWARDYADALVAAMKGEKE